MKPVEAWAVVGDEGLLSRDEEMAVWRDRDIANAVARMFHSKPVAVTIIETAELEELRQLAESRPNDVTVRIPKRGLSE